MFFMKQWEKELRAELGDALEIRGPVSAPIEKIKDQYRFQFWYFTPSVSRIINALSQLRADYKSKLDKSVREWIDVDPIQMS